MPLKLIIFDLDGTLVDTVKDITNALNFALKPYGQEVLSVQDTRKMVGEGITKLIEKVLGDRKSRLSNIVSKRFLDYYTKHIIDYSSPYPRVRETLEKLNGYKKAVISNKREYLSRMLLDKLDLLKYFDLVVGSDTTSERKPSPVPVIYAITKLSAGSHESVMVGDSNYDIEAGKKAGLKTIAVTYGYKEREHLVNADQIIDSLQDLLALLDINSTKFI
jgi:phosphoglycolate phosphatase